MEVLVGIVVVLLLGVLLNVRDQRLQTEELIKHVAEQNKLLADGFEHFKLTWFSLAEPEVEYEPEE